MQFISQKPHFEYLRKKWTSRHKATQDKFWEKHGGALKQVAIGSLGGLMLLTPTKLPTVQTPLFASRDDVLKGYDKNVLLAQSLSEKVPQDVAPLEKQQENDLTDTLSKDFGFKVTAQINSIRLSRNYGLIGGEQHLARYPGDTLYDHADTSVDWAKYGSSGMAPGLGAWGYFATSKNQFDETAKQREKYYLAIQTFLAPGFAENVAEYRDFFKFRKMLVVNPHTGQAVVAVIADAGPAEFTGKHLGGSPEVMDGLGLADGPRKGAVLYFFIDDPKNQVPLGPVKVTARLAQL